MKPAKDSPAKSIDWLQVMLVSVGAVLFTFGVTITLRDAFNDYNLGVWGILGGAVAGLGAVALAFARRV